MSHLGKTPTPISTEEFERRVQESRGTMSASVSGLMYALQKLINPKAAEAVEVLKDMKAGHYDENEKVGGDGGDSTSSETMTTLENTELSRKPAEGEDA
jgi:hypothetical protein